MEEVKSLAKWWNNEVMVPSLSISLCIVSGPGALLLLRNLTNLMSVWGSTSSTSSCSFPMSNLWSSGSFRRIKIPMVILYELIDFIKVIRIKMFTLNAAVSFDWFGKEFRFVGISLGDFVVVVQCWIVALTLGLEDVFGFAPRLAWIAL